MTFHSHGPAQACDTRCPSHVRPPISYVRVYQFAGVEYLCGVFCNIRGPGIEQRDVWDLAEITCPNCLMILGARS